MSTENLTQQEISQKAFRNFRTNVDIENFYRFVHENDLRREAKMLLDVVATRLKKPTKRRKRSKKVQ